MERRVEVLLGPEGHRRSLILGAEFAHLGAQVRYTTHLRHMDPRAALWIVDVPREALDAVFKRLKNVRLRMRARVILMGCVDRRATWCWHPLGVDEATENCPWVGPRYLILPGTLIRFYKHAQAVYDLAVYAGAAHPLRKAIYGRRTPKGWKVFKAQQMTWEGFLMVLSQARRALLGWGQSVFEALYIGVPVLAVAATPEHVREAGRLGVPIVTSAEELARRDVFERFALPHVRHQIDLQGAKRVAEDVWRMLWAS